MKILRLHSKELEKIYIRGYGRKRRIIERVRKIIEDVCLEGDDALLRYTRKFDRVKLTPKQLKVTEGETSGAYQNIDPGFVPLLKSAIDRVTNFYKGQIVKSWKMKEADGTILGERYEPIERLGIYIPGGTASFISTVYMTVVPARIAGVKTIVLTSPPNKYGSIDPYILAVASLLKVNEIYKVGGAQAIAGLAFGTKTIPKVDKIIGPGNEYVTEAKRQVFGYVDIDMLAGPSEVAIIANQFVNPEYVISDLLAQMEHRDGLAILITTSKTLARTVKERIDKKGYIIKARNLDEAVDVANRIAPEHLQIMVKNPQRLAKKITNAGAIFLGPYSPVAVGDYIAGPSHVLPTNGSARFFSGLGLEEFMKTTHIISYSKKALETVRESLEKIAAIEGMEKHAESVRVRL